MLLKLSNKLCFIYYSTYIHKSSIKFQNFVWCLEENARYKSENKLSQQLQHTVKDEFSYLLRNAAQTDLFYRTLVRAEM